MDDFFKRLRDQAITHKAELNKERSHKKNPENTQLSDAVFQQVAEYTGKPFLEVAYCCGNICPHCQTFLDKAIALVELGYKHHLFMNPVQEEFFEDALAIYRRDRKEYEIRKQELMDRMR
jgi:hypothetical protein